MCNQEYALEHKIPLACRCSCFASFYQCEDDLIDATLHEQISMVHNPNHYWVVDRRTEYVRS